MKSIFSRLGRLENRLTPRVDTAYAAYMNDRLDQGRRRLEQARLRGEYERTVHVEVPNGSAVARRSMVEILQAGRERAGLEAIR